MSAHTSRGSQRRSRAGTRSSGIGHKLPLGKLLLCSALLCLPTPAAAAELVDLQPCGCRVPAGSPHVPPTYPSYWGGQCAAYDVGCADVQHCCRPYCVVSPACESAVPHPLLFPSQQQDAGPVDPATIYISYAVCFDDALSRQQCNTETQLAWQNSLQEQALAEGEASVGASACECTGSNRGIPVWLYGQHYGTSCAAWDIDQCAQWWGDEQGVELGAWCCEPWCYVNPATCPSAHQSSLQKELYYAYGSCGVDLRSAYTCPHADAPADAEGEPSQIRRPSWTTDLQPASSATRSHLIVALVVLSMLK